MKSNRNGSSPPLPSQLDDLGQTVWPLAAPLYDGDDNTRTLGFAIRIWHECFQSVALLLMPRAWVSGGHRLPDHPVQCSGMGPPTAGAPRCS